MLNVLSLVELFPNDIEKQTALDFHLQAATRARQDYERRKRDLFEFVDAKMKELANSKAQRKHPAEKSGTAGSGPKREWQRAKRQR